MASNFLRDTGTDLMGEWNTIIAGIETGTGTEIGGTTIIARSALQTGTGKTS